MSAIGLIGTAVSLAGSFMQASAQNKMVQEQTNASKRAENSRQQQMQLESQRQRRSAVREAIINRATAQSVGVAQGAQYGSGVAAAMGNAVSEGQYNVNTTNQGQNLGNRIFKANRDYFDATAKGQKAMSVGAGISAIGGAITSNAGTISQVGTYYSQRPA
jgi:hypothetical protein